MAIYLTYDAEKCTDGSGAQVQRIIAIYCLAKRFGLKYFRSQIIDLDFNPGDGISSPEEMNNYRNRLNKFLNFLDHQEPNAHEIWEFQFWNLPTAVNNRQINTFVYLIYFNFLKFYSRIRNRDMVLKIANPHPLADKIPDIYEKIMPKLHNPFVLSGSKLFEIHMHLVRSKVTKDQLNRRFTEDSWYLEILSSVIQLLDKYNIRYEVILHTDVNKNQSWVIPDGYNKQSVQYWKDAGIEIIDNEMAVVDESALAGFKEIQNLRVVTGVDPLLAWAQIAKADLFLMGKSSFSFVGALLNPTGIIVGQEFWHKFPKSWLGVERPSEVYISDLLRSIERQIESGIFKTFH
jgi:hypothetical protein